MITEMKLRRVEPDITIFEISGRLSLGNSLIGVENSIRRLVEEGARKLVIDLGSLNAIDSSGIGLLVSSSGHIEQKGGQMRIAGAQGAVAKALGMVHVDRIAPLDTDVESSCRHFAVDSASV
jgi:anti-sigma B factor antagonist